MAGFPSRLDSTARTRRSGRGVAAVAVSGALAATLSSPSARFASASGAEFSPPLAGRSSSAHSETVLTVEDWREDLFFLAERMIARHPDLFFSVPREEFEAAVNDLAVRIPELSDNQIIAELYKVAALPFRNGRDGQAEPFRAHQAHWTCVGQREVEPGR